MIVVLFEVLFYESSPPKVGLKRQGGKVAPQASRILFVVDK